MKNINSGYTKKYKKLLIKISGESLKSSKNGDIFDKSTIFNFIKQIKILVQENYKIALVIGGGNIWRGKTASNIGLDNITGDYMGMIATVINAIAIRKILIDNEVDSEIYLSMFIPSVGKYINHMDMIEDYKSKVLVFGGGTGSANFSTDSCAALRALELNCDLLLIGKNGTKGVYNCDPNVYPDAVFYDKLTYEEIINKNLNVMDQTALTLCRNSNLEIRVFDIQKNNSFVDVLHNKIEYTKIKD